MAAEEERGTYGYTWVPRAEEADAYLAAQAARAATGRLAPFAQISLATGRAVGATAYWEPRSWPTEDRLDAVEVGEVARVDLRTDARDSRSRAAVRSAGAAGEPGRVPCAQGIPWGTIPRKRRADGRRHGLLVWIILHSFAAHPDEAGHVSEGMTKVTGGKCLPWASGRKNRAGDRVVPLGSYAYIPAPTRAATPANGILTKGGTPVALRETEPILRDFLNVMGELQDDLAGRWAAMRERPVFSRAE